MYLLFDIGGTFTRVAISQNGKNIKKQKKVETPQNFGRGIRLIKNVADELACGASITAAGGGIAGPLDKKKTRLVNSPNLPQWVNKAFKKELEKAIKTEVLLENDTALVGLGEATAGAGKNFNIVVYITISTGVNGVRIIDGTIDRNAMGFEIGHQIINHNRGIPQTLEELISGEALTKRYGKLPSKITADLVWYGLIPWLVYGLNNVIVHWSPEVVVLGGSVATSFNPYLATIKKNLKKILTIYPVIPYIRMAKLKDSGGLYGALALLHQHQKRTKR